MEERKLICQSCNVEMKPAEVSFHYMKFDFKHTLPRCPQCGQVYIPEELARTRMAEVEAQLEDK